MFEMMGSPHAMVGSCIVSLFLSSNTPQHAVLHPICSVSLSVIFGGIAGKFLEHRIPDELKPYVVGTILVLTGLNLGARYMGIYPEQPSIKSIYDSVSNEHRSMRISYTAHSILDNIGPTITIDKPLTGSLVRNIIMEAKESLDFKIISAIDTIASVVDDIEFIDKISGIFIHNSEHGFVLIKCSNNTSPHTLSIRI